MNQLIEVTCTNRNCSENLTFEAEMSGSVQTCSNCGQQLIVPQFSSSAESVSKVPAVASSSAPKPVNIPSTQSQVYYQPTYQERAGSAKRSRKVNTSAGCVSLVAVLVAFGVMILGVSFITEIKDNMIGWIIIIGALLSIGAFVFFGYFATETIDSSDRIEKQ